MTDDTVIINIGDKTMEQVFKATDITNVHESNLQAIFDRIEELLAEQCFSVREGYHAIAWEVDEDEPPKRPCDISEALTLRSAEDVRREALEEAANVALDEPWGSGKPRDIYYNIRALIDNPQPSTDTTTSSTGVTNRHTVRSEKEVRREAMVEVLREVKYIVDSGRPILHAIQTMINRLSASTEESQDEPVMTADEFLNFTRPLPRYPYDEQFDTQREVELNPCGAWAAIQHMSHHTTPSVEEAAQVLLDDYRSDDSTTDYNQAWEAYRNALWRKDESIYAALESFLQVLAAQKGGE